MRTGLLSFLPFFGLRADYAAGNRPGSVFGADVHGDGDNDMAVTNSGSCCDFSVSVLMNNGDGTFAPRMDYPAGGFSVFSADLDGDGDNDLVTSQVSVLLNNGDGTICT